MLALPTIERIEHDFRGACRQNKNIYLYLGLAWSQRPLFPAPDRDEVCMDEYYAITATFGSQIIYMEEEIEGDVVIAKLNYNGKCVNQSRNFP